VTDATVNRGHVAVVLLNFQASAETLACIQSLQAQAYRNWSLWLVDNASGDDEQAQLSAAVDRVHQTGRYSQWFPLRDNRGYSAGNNVALRAIASDTHAAIAPYTDPPRWVWLLNNDTTVAPDALSRLVQRADERQNTWVGPVLYDTAGQFQQAGIRFNAWTGSARGIKPTELTQPFDALSGASLLLPVSALATVGLLPESYFLYFEDVAWCLTAARQAAPNRYRMGVCPDARVYHAGGATTGRKPRTRDYYYERNRMVTTWRFASMLQKVTLLVYTGFRLLRTALKAITRARYRHALAVQGLALYDAATGRMGPCRWQLD
jgi:N-acetylglucosaminyl-diphospho-decaprenol L-rhamnosyltransferase